MGSKKFTVELKKAESIKEMVAAVKSAASANDIDFKGDEKKGSGGRAGAKISYVVTGTRVDISVEDSWRSRLANWDAARLEKEVRKWIGPYIK
ncbi:MAG TPA: hypothetical protein VK843_03115 [Planctomycetota bacterium]|nr:hypothetical protein [Planctomycetota bacterium]